MSWAANNPEAYDEACLVAITQKIVALDPQCLIEEATSPVIDIIKDNCPKAYTELLRWAQEEVSDKVNTKMSGGIL